jgi:hypothetical protein
MKHPRQTAGLSILSGFARSKTIRLKKRMSLARDDINLPAVRITRRLVEAPKGRHTVDRGDIEEERTRKLRQGQCGFSMRDEATPIDQQRSRDLLLPAGAEPNLTE